MRGKSVSEDAIRNTILEIRRGRLVKQSSATLRTAMIQSAHGMVLIKYDNRPRTFFQKFNTAVAALANKML